MDSAHGRVHPLPVDRDPRCVHPDPLTPLEKLDLETAFLREKIRRGQPGKPGANDGDPPSLPLVLRLHVVVGKVEERRK